MRERMSAHRDNPACAACHAMIDPAGFALEHFDAIDRWRAVDESYNPIDASGALPDGTPFEGAAGLRAALTRRPERFVTTVTEKLMTYALGRGVEHYDMPAAEGGADLHVRTAGEPRPSRSYFRAAEPTGFTALLFAVRAGAIEATRALLDAGADVDDALSDGQTALVVAAANAHWELASRLLDRGADPAAAGAGWNALHQTVRTRRPNPSGGVAGPIPTGRVDSIDVVRKLIAHGVDVDPRMTVNGMKDGQRSRLNRLGATAFFLAAKNTDTEAMGVLVEAGADPMIPSADGTTPLMVAAGVAIFIPGEDGGSLPGQEGEVLEAVRMCVEAGTDVNAVNDRRETALHGAAFRGVNAVVDYLVEQGAALDVRTVEGWTSLALANGLSYSDF